MLPYAWIGGLNTLAKINRILNSIIHKINPLIFLKKPDWDTTPKTKANLSHNEVREYFKTQNKISLFSS